MQVDVEIRVVVNLKEVIPLTDQHPKLPVVRILEALKHPPYSGLLPIHQFHPDYRVKEFEYVQEGHKEHILLFIHLRVLVIGVLRWLFVKKIGVLNPPLFVYLCIKWVPDLEDFGSFVVAHPRQGVAVNFLALLPSPLGDCRFLGLERVCENQ